MKTVETNGPLTLVVQSETRGLDANDNGGGETYAHFVLNRYKLDDDGNICLTRPQRLDQLRSAIELFKARLDFLVERAIQGTSPK